MINEQIIKTLELTCETDRLMFEYIYAINYKYQIVCLGLTLLIVFLIIVVLNLNNKIDKLK